MFRTDRTTDRQLFAFTPRDLIADQSDVWLYIDLFDQLDLEDFDADYVSQGQPGLDPRLVLRSIFYGLTHGIASGKRLADVCRHDNRYIVLSGEQFPNTATLNRFVVRHGARLEALFVQIVRLAQKMGLAKLGRVAIDGTRLKGKTSKHKAMSYERMQAAIEVIKAELAKLKEDLSKENAQASSRHEDQLPAEIARREKRLAKIQAAKKALEDEADDEVVKPTAQKSFHDLEALPLASKNKEFIYGYNGQAVVDDTSQIIVACDLHDSSSDSQALTPLLAQVQDNCGQSAAEVLADAGYRGPDNLRAIEAQGGTPFVATGKGEDLGEQTLLEQIQPGDNPHVYQCIAGKTLPIKSRNSDGSTVLQVPGRFCNNCPLRDFCAIYKRRGKRVKIPAAADREIQSRNLARLRSDEGREVYRRRKVIVEPAFGNIKNKGMKILVKGKQRVRTWWRMACTAHNLEKIARHLAMTTAAPA
jgi:transposase